MGGVSGGDWDYNTSSSPLWWTITKGVAIMAGLGFGVNALYKCEQDDKRERADALQQAKSAIINNSTAVTASVVINGASIVTGEMVQQEQTGVVDYVIAAQKVKELKFAQQENEMFLKSVDQILKESTPIIKQAAENSADVKGGKKTIADQHPDTIGYKIAAYKLAK